MSSTEVVPNSKLEGWLETFKRQDWKFYTGIFAAVALAGLGVGALYYSTRTNSSQGDKKKPKKKVKGDLESTSDIQPLLEEISPNNSQFGIIDSLDEDLKKILNLDSIGIVKASSEEKTDYIKRLKEEGNTRFRSRNYKEAIIFYSKGLEIETNSILFCNRAACYANEGDYKKTIADCNSAIALNSSYMKAYLRRGQAHEHLALYTEALEDYTAAEHLSDPRNDVAISSGERVLAIISSKKAKEIFDSRESSLPCNSIVENFIKQYKFELISKPTEKETPGDEAYRLANNSIVESKYEEALKNVEVAIQNNTKFLSEALVLRGMFSILLLQENKALVDLETACGLAPTKALPRLVRSTALLQLDRIEEAFHYLNEAKEVDPENCEVYYQYGQVLSLSGDFEGAIREYMECIKLSSSHIMAQIQLGVAQYKINNIVAADQTYQKLVKSFPDSPEVHNYYAELLFTMERYDEALISLEKSLACDPSFLLAHVNKAMYYTQIKQFPDAEASCLKAIESDPRSDVANEALGQVYLAQKKRQLAVKAFLHTAKIARSEREIMNAIALSEVASAEIRFYEAHPHLDTKVIV